MKRWASAILAATAFNAAAQSVQTPVDQGIEDTDPLRRSLRVLPEDLRQPTGFGHAYRVQGDPNMFMRRDGGLTAVFPHSTYQRVPGGISADIPAGTTFYIGQAPWEVDRARPGLLPGEIDLRVPPGPPTKSVVPYEPRTILTDEAFRRRRVEVLLRAACAAEQQRR